MIDRHVLSDGATVEVLLAPEATRVIEFLESIAEELGWRPPAGALLSHEDESRFVVHERNGEILGAVKLVLNTGGHTLPILDVWPELPIVGTPPVAELSVLAMAPSARGRGSSFLPLAAEVWRCCHQEGAMELWAELEPRMLAIYRRFGWPFEIAGELREYWGDPLYPCRMCLFEAGASFIDHAAEQEAYAEAVEQALRE